ncbi:VWA domain-containing protein, partial [Candidatus Poribacteria bacterium]|nr:VWA domain-containing protein [Candidatus Poribacteria bacterium]
FKIRPIIPKERKKPVVEEEPEEAEPKIVEEKSTPETPSFDNFPGISDTDVFYKKRSSEEGRKINSVKTKKKTGLASAKPIQQDIISTPKINNTDNNSFPQLVRESGEISGNIQGDGFQGNEVGPLRGGSISRGTSEMYVDVMGSVSISQQSGKRVNQMSKILPELAGRISEIGKNKKMDIVFVVDTTGSMRDNVTGVKNHIKGFLEIIEDEGFDVDLGLVQFTDQETRKPKIDGLTGSVRKFKKWLDKVVFMGGGDVPESGYEAMISALEEIKFRNDAQHIFVFMSDAPQHDLDYDGKSRYTLDRILSKLTDEEITVHVIGANYRPMKLLAQSTGGTWRHIPGGNPVYDVPDPSSHNIKSRLGGVLAPVLFEDKVTIQLGEPIPQWVDLSYKMLDPRGFKCLGTLTYRQDVSPESGRELVFSPVLDLRKFQDQSGIYTMIYRMRDSAGNWDVLRRTFEIDKANG